MQMPVATQKISAFVPHEPELFRVLRILTENPTHVMITANGRQLYDLSPGGKLRMFLAPKNVNFHRLTGVQLTDYIDGLLENLPENERE